MNRTAHRAGAVALLFAAACSTTPRSGTAPASVVWPEPPDAPRVRLVSVFPDADAARPPPPLWKRLVAAIAGTDDPEDAPAPLLRPFGVAADGHGGFFVADPDRPAVLRVAGGRADPIVCAERPWHAPMGIAAAPDGAVLVTDVDAVIRVDAGGKCAALGQPIFERATGVATAGARIYVTDPPRHEVVVLSASGEVTGRLGGPEAGPAALHFPSAVATTPDDGVLVADTFGFSVARWDASGAFVGRVGGQAAEHGGLQRPKGLAVGADGRIYVSDAERDQVVVYSPGGAPEYRFGATGGAPGRFAHPAGLAIAAGRALVADSLNGRIQIFEFVGGTP